MSKSNKFGTFGGVFTPSILTILGVIMYLRLPMIVGEAGLLGTLGIIIIAHLISATTGLSVSSIATDKRVAAGGTYYMISRSLGLPIGGTLGLALFVGLSFSVSLYLIGFAESFLSYWEMDTSLDSIRMTGTIILVVVTTITFISTSLAIKTQYFIMAAILLSLVSIFAGAGHHPFPAGDISFSIPESASLMLLFGIFFPAVTGFEAGVSMSGDLKDPKKSIPVGSILAIIVGLVVYVGLAFFFSYTVSGDALAQNGQVLLEISWVPALVIAGIWGATLSSALGSILGAPRILQATAVDKITPKFFSKGVGKANEPRNALIVTFLIAEVGILIGELDVIARIVSIFFITTYGFLNLSCAFEAWTSADFRPSFKTPVWVSLLGAMACFIVMIQLDFVATLGATIILGLLFLYLKRRQLTLQSGDAWSGVWASLTKTGLQRLSKTTVVARNWRPNIILFNGSETARPYLTELGVSIAGNLGILSSFELVQSDNETLLVKAQRNISEADKSARYFQHKHTCRNIYAGMDEIARVYGFTGVEPNTILMGWSRKEKHREDFLKLIRNFERSDYNSLFVTYNPQRKFGDHKTIDIWWSGWGKNLSLAVNLLRHISTTGEWKSARIRLLVICQDVTLIEKTYHDLTRIIDQFRINMDVNVINNSVDQLTRVETIARESGNTDLTIIGIPDRRYEELEQTYDEVNELSERLGTALFINASSIFEEYTLSYTDEHAAETAIDDQVFTLPELEPSRYPVIAHDVAKIDTHGRAVLEKFYDKTFLPYFKITNTIHHDLLELAKATASALDGLSTSNAFKRSETLYRVRRYFFNEANAILEKFVSTRLPELLGQMEEGLTWYSQQLDSDITRFPKRLTIRYHKEDFEPSSQDTRAIRWLKFRKRLWSPFAGSFITGSIAYREVAAYYLRDSRHHFLSALLEDFHRSTRVNQEKIQAFIGFVDGELEKLERKTEGEEKHWQDSADNLVNKTNSFIEEGNRLARLYEGRLQVEFRRNLQILSNHLERININHLIREKRTGVKYYQEIKQQNMAFPARWVERTTQEVNKTRVSVLMRALRTQILHDIREFNQRIDRAVQNKIVVPLQRAKDTLQQSPHDQEVVKKIEKVEWRLQLDILIEEFEELGGRLAEHARSLPEEIITPAPGGESSAKEEGNDVVIPLSKIAHHFLETTLISPLHEQLTKILEQMKSVVFNINDQLSLASFNVDNIDKEDDKTEAVKTVMLRTAGELEKDEARLSELKKEMKDLSYKLVQDLFGPLSEYKLVQTTSEFGHLVRGYRSKQVLTRFGKWTRRVQEYFRNKILVLLYSRSEGILLAQRLSESKNLKSINERILDLVDRVTPDTDILSQLPHYYQNLFSGRSSIGENFWVSRSIEEKQVEKALYHYREGYRGGVLVLGERNSGKTALCRYIVEKQIVGRNVIHVFSINEGSVSVDDFARELGRATGINGDVYSIMSTLPNQSTIVIHDLELWWERSTEGMAVVRLIMELITTYAEKCLFVINMNPFAFALIDALENIQDRFISIVRCQPFSSIELKNLIITRHRSSGLTFTFSRRKEEKISELRLARLFNQYFNYSDGNPGMAMSAWLNSIQNVSGKTLTIKPPVRPMTDVFYSIPESWSVVLIQLILHKRMYVAKMKRVLLMDDSELRDHIMALQRAGLIQERTNGLYVVNPYVEPLMVDVFKKNDWL